MGVDRSAVPGGDDAPSGAGSPGPSLVGAVIGASAARFSKTAAASGDGTTRFGSEGSGCHGMVMNVTFSGSTCAARRPSEVMSTSELSPGSTVSAEVDASRNE